MGQVAPLVHLPALLGVERLLADVAPQLQMMLLLMGLQCCCAAAPVAALLAGHTHLELVHAPTVVSQCGVGAEASITVGAGFLQAPRVTPEPVPPHVIQRAAAEVARRAEMCGVFVVDAHLVLTQFGHSPERLVTRVALVTADPRVEGLVLLHAISPGRAEGTESAAVGPRSPVFQGDVLRHAPVLFAGERAAPTVQTLPFSSIQLLFVVNTQVVASQSRFRFGHEETGVALDLTWLHAASPLVAGQRSVLAAPKGTFWTRDDLRFLHFPSGFIFTLSIEFRQHLALLFP